MKRLAIITTHPIQYYAPLFRLLHTTGTGFFVKVFYTLSQAQERLHDPDFGMSVQWDVPLLDGYEYTFVDNISANPGSRRFRGIINPGLIKEIENWKADTVMVIGWAFESHLKALRYFHGKLPVLFRGDSNLLDEQAGFSAKKWLRRKFLRWVYSHVDYGLYVGEANKQYYQVHGLKPNQLFFAPHAIDNNRFSADAASSETKAQQWRSDLGIAKEAITFLFAGKLTTKKAPELLIKAFLALQQANANLVIVGNGELEAELKQRYGQVENIVFLPFQNQSIMPVVYRLADVFVLPSEGPGETWGLAVNEAMTCGRAVIVSDKCGCAQDLVQSGKNGYVFNSGDILHLQDCLKSSLINYKLLGKKSLDIIQLYNYKRTIEQLRVIMKNESEQ